MKYGVMRRIAPMIGWLLISGAMSATGLAEDIQGQLVIIRPLTKQRVVIPTYDVRGVTPAKQSDNGNQAINEWDRVVVYLEGDAAPEAARVIATINQKGQRFEPEMVVVPVGSTVSFPNSDPIFHNVFSLSKVRQFDLGFYPAGETRLVRFTKPGVVQAYCHLHPDMSAAILVVPNAWYTRPNDRGEFTFSGLPIGEYQVVVWHKSAGLFRKQVRVPAGNATKVVMEIPLGSNP
jgi:plastocyanin